MSQLLSTLLSGIAQAMPLFLVASGLSLILGVMHILNFAHGAFFAFGAFFLVTLLGSGAPTMLLMVGAILAAGLFVGAVGLVSERLVFRRLYERDHFISLLASYALLLVMEGVALQVWGPNPRTQTQTPALAGAIRFGDITVATYDLVLILAGIAIGGGLWFLIQKTPFGRTVRAVAHDRMMASALGIRAASVGASVFFIGAFLAGVAGGLVAPLVSVEPALGAAFIIQSFAVVIIGGLGSIKGAFVAALTIGIAESAAVSYLPIVTGFSLYIAMAVVLLIRPQGLFGEQKLEGMAA